VWAGIPLGAFDDLFSGQPLGSAIMLWSLSMLAIEIIEIRFKWRAFWQDWAIAGVMITLYVLAAAPIARFALTPQHLAVMAPQIVFSILLFPVIARLVARLDRARLSRVRTLN
jgi:rod shape-determining protein MreD